MSCAYSGFYHAPGSFSWVWITERLELSISPEPTGKLAASAANQIVQDDSWVVLIYQVVSIPPSKHDYEQLMFRRRNWY